MTHKITDRFTLIGEDGQAYEVIETRPENTWGDSSGGGRRLGTRSLNTTDGWAVEPLDQNTGRYRVMDFDGTWINATRQ